MSVRLRAAASAPPRPAGTGGPAPLPPEDDDQFSDAERGEANEGPAASTSPIGRLRARRSYWLATMHQIGLVCALTLSVIDTGFRLDWCPSAGPPPRRWLRNHPSARANSAFVSEKVAEGVASGTMVRSTFADLWCILPLGVASNAAGKLRLIWDGRHVNRHLGARQFRMETLQREGRALFERSSWGGTLDLQSAYHHVEMDPGFTQYLGFEWKGEFYRFVVLPFGLSHAPWVFSKMMAHCARFLRSPGLGLGILQYLDDVIFAAPTARESLSAAQTLMHVLRRFGWLVHPTKCCGVSQAVQAFQALGTWVDLATQTFSVPPATVRRILDAAEALASGPVQAPVRVVARFRGLVSSTWISTGLATRIRTRALAAVVDSRPQADPTDKRAQRRSWAASVVVDAAAREEARWWIWFLPLFNGAPIRPPLFDSSVDGDIASDASDTGVGAFVCTRHGDPASSCLLRGLAAMAPAGFAMAAVVSYAQRGLEFAAPLPAELLSASSTLRELFGVARFILAAAHLLRGGRFRLFLDNLGCVFILGGVIPAFAQGGRAWGEYVHGGSPVPEIQRLALQIFQAQLEHGFQLQAIWQPRELNVRADFLSRAFERTQHAYRLLPSLFRWLDERWGPHSIDRFACPSTCQPLAPPFEGRFCSKYFHPDAAWTDAFSVPWGDENNWLFPPVPDIARTIAHLRASRAMGTLIVPFAAWAPWIASLRRGRRWAADVTGLVRLGPPHSCLSLPRDCRSLFKGCELIALRLDGRALSLSGDVA